MAWSRCADHPLLLALAATAGAVHVLGVGLDSPDLALPGGAVALLALAGCAAIAGRHRPPLRRWTLMAGVLVVAAATATGRVSDVSATETRSFGWFAYQPLCAECLGDFAAYDPWFDRWLRLLALVAAACFALAALSRPADRGPGDAVAVTAIGALLLFGYAALDIWSASDITPASRIEAIPGLLPAAVALGAATVVAGRTTDRAAWVGLALLGLSALRGAGDAVEGAATMAGMV